MASPMPEPTTPTRKSSAELKVIPLPDKRELSEEHLEHLRTSGLTSETLELASVYTERAGAKIAGLLHWNRWQSSLGTAIIFPFFVPSKSDPVMYRARPDRPRSKVTKGKRKPVKYEQPKDVAVLPYFPPRTRRDGLLKSADAPLLWVEGEKKGLLLDQLGYAAIAGTGVWAFHDVEHRDAEGTWQLHPVIREHTTIAGREHRIVFDSDAATNDSVMTAARRLAGMLEAEGGAVRFVQIPTEGDEKLGIDDYFVKFGEDATRALLETGVIIEPLPVEEALTPLLKIRAFAEAPIDASLRMPATYEVDRSGALWRKPDKPDGEDRLVAKSAILIRRIVIDLYTGEERVELVFKRRGRWKTALVDRRTIADTRQAVADLAPVGAPIDSLSAGEVVRWFSELDSVNEEIIPRATSVSRCGWHQVDDGTVFSAPEAVGADLDLVFDGRGGRSRMVRALRAHGEFEAHLAVLTEAFAADRKCATVICAALAAPLIHRVGAPGFAVHLVGDSSRGKSSMLKIAASLYGDPSNEDWVPSWNSTAVGLEMRAATLCDLPFCIDEAGVVDPVARERAVYMLIDGTGRTRGSKLGGLRDTPSWRTIVISTGERGLVDESANTGAQVRILQFEVDGFGGLDASGVDSLRGRCEEQFGAVGRRWLELLAEIDDWSPIQSRFRQLVADLRERAPGGGLRARQVTYFALLALAERMAARLLGIGDENGVTMADWVEEDLGTGSQRQVETAAERALDLVQDWVASRPASFVDMTIDFDGEPSPKTSGAREVFGYRTRNAIYFVPLALRTFLEEHNLDSNVTKDWKRRGWLITTGEGDGRATYRVRLGGELHRVIAVKKSAFEARTERVPESPGNLEEAPF